MNNPQAKPAANEEEPDTAAPEDTPQAGDAADHASTFAEMIQNAAEMAGEEQTKNDAARELANAEQEPADSTESEPAETQAVEQEPVQPMAGTTSW